jgi:predicted enzyme related to lactoylglutathione lyase
MAAKKAKKATKKSPAPKKGAVKKVAAKKAAARKVAPKKPAAKKAAPRKAPKPKGPLHQVVHWEIQSKSPERLHDFYRDVFAWEINTDNPMKYGMVSSGGDDEGINGGIGGSMGPASRVLVYASVPDIEDALAKINEKGGRTVLPRSDMGMVVLAVFEDPEGNQFGLVEDEP